MQPQGNSNLYSDNLYMFYVPTYFNVHYKSIVTIAMTMSPDFFAGSEIQSTQMPPELWLFSAQVLKVEAEGVTHFPKQTASKLIYRTFYVVNGSWVVSIPSTVNPLPLSCKKSFTGSYQKGLH